jgi:tetratricopeptide (TPR) repeat protein
VTALSKQPDKPSRDEFDALRKKGREQADRNEVREALATCELALDWAKQYGDRDDEDLVFCNRASILIHAGQGNKVVGKLQQLLMRSHNHTNRCLAAYNISQYYDAKNIKKSSFYAQLALDYANQMQSTEWIGRCHNRLANVLVADSLFTEAETHYLLGNLGYCLLLNTDRPREGLRHLLAARRLFTRIKFGWRPTLGRLRLSLCYGYIELERLDRARRHGITALRLGEEIEDTDLVKKALYLLGEVEKQDSNYRAAEDYFIRLREYYPENPYLVELLMHTQTHKLINLWV